MRVDHTNQHMKTCVKKHTSKKKTSLIHQCDITVRHLKTWKKATKLWLVKVKQYNWSPTDIDIWTKTPDPDTSTMYTKRWQGHGLFLVGFVQPERSDGRETGCPQPTRGCHSNRSRRTIEHGVRRTGRELSVAAGMFTLHTLWHRSRRELTQQRLGLSYQSFVSFSLFHSLSFILFVQFHSFRGLLHKPTQHPVWPSVGPLCHAPFHMYRPCEASSGHICRPTFTSQLNFFLFCNI